MKFIHTIVEWLLMLIIGKDSAFLVPYIAKGVVSLDVIKQRVFGVDRNCPYLINFTSRVINGDKLEIYGDEDTIEPWFSLAASGGCYINASNGVRIGSGTIFAFNVTIVSSDHDFDSLNECSKGNPVVIGKNCWLGSNTSILSGVVLGDHTIVGANCVVTKSFPEGNVVLAGVPARIIKKL